MSQKIKVLTRRSGRNAKPVDVLEDCRILQETINALHHQALIPRGVYRFRSFDDSYQWMLQAMASTHERLQSKTF